ncbi:recombinase family protein [Microvirga rosea]|uniref:recombinase family protein n=1 Tax=Microvirga rosea TaxID=2715425 RepID=UPI001D0AE62B|nr:recombinase family protein [Microvirga rosea]MCB8823536.1 recombinase family protein [Microvirga rosea]
MGPSPSKQRLIGYARVSTEDQAHEAQLDELRAAGCQAIHQEHGSGASRARPVLARLLREIKPGETLVVVRLDRLARSVKHLLEVIEGLEGRGAHFRSLRDPIDTSTPQGMFSLQVLGAVAQLERALIAERTRSGIEAARRRGRQPGNPGLRTKDPLAIRKITSAKDATYLQGLIDSTDTWLPTVQRLRPQCTWETVAGILNGKGQSWTVERLRRSTRRLVREGIAEPALLTPTPRRPSSERLLAIVAAITTTNPNLSLRDIGEQLEKLHERTPRGGRRWSASSVKSLLDRARASGLIIP